MSVFIIDLCFPFGHRELNFRYINVLKSITDVKIINDGEYYNRFREVENIQIIDAEMYKIENHQNPLKTRGNILKNMFTAHKIIKRCANQEDIIIFFSYDVVTFAMLGFLFYKFGRVLLFEHNSIDELKRSIKLYLYNIYKNQVGHLVFENKFKKYLIEKINVKNEFVFVIPHCLRNIHLEKKQYYSKYRISNLSRTTDEKWIEAILEEEKHSHFLEEASVYMTLRSKLISYNNKVSLEILNGRLSDEQYNQLLISSNAIICMNTGFENRITGSFFDAISGKKLLISTPNDVLDEWAKEFPGIICTFNSINELKEIIRKMPINPFEQSLNQIRAKYSDNSIEQSWLDCFTNIGYFENGSPYGKA